MDPAHLQYCQQEHQHSLSIVNNCATDKVGKRSFTDRDSTVLTVEHVALHVQVPATL